MYQRLAALADRLVEFVEVANFNPAQGTSTPRRRRRRVFRTAFILAVLLLTAGVIYEIRTSSLQSYLLSAYASRLSFSLQRGASARIHFPSDGPLDKTRGYSAIPAFVERLEGKGYRVVEQSRFSDELLRVTDWGLTPPFPDVVSAGLIIKAASGAPIFKASEDSRFFGDLGEIPAIVVNTLLFIENRELANLSNPQANPVVEWDRLGKASFLYLGGKIGLPVRVEGGSTLAIQIEKYKHSAGGRTGSGLEKMRQIASASLKVYQGGPDTRLKRQETVVEYLNSMPLGAAPGYGELYGLGEGLYAWFGLGLDDVLSMLDPAAPFQDRVGAYKHVLTLIAAVRAPSRYLTVDRTGLEQRVQHYVRLLAAGGFLEKEFAEAVLAAPVHFIPRAPVVPRPSFAKGKEINQVRTSLLQLLGTDGFYELDRLHLEAGTTIDSELQMAAEEMFGNLKDPRFVRQKNFLQDRLLLRGDPSQVVYSLLLFEKTPQANLLRVQADSLEQPLDLNRGMKLELGSTAKLRTLTHYLEILTALHRTWLRNPESTGLRLRDPLTRWATGVLQREPGMTLEQFLERGMERTYSASPQEPFFTGGGVHYFHNFDSRDSRSILTVRRALEQSVNLVFIRLMRDLVYFHQARLDYDAEGILNRPDHPERRALLQEIAAQESRTLLFQNYQRFRRRSQDEIIADLLGSKADSARHLSMLFFAWNSNAGDEDLAKFLRLRLPGTSAAEAHKWAQSYRKPHLTIADFGYLLDRHPLEVWAAGLLAVQPQMTWTDLLQSSEEVQQVASAWLFKTRNRRPQDLRLRIRIERDAFERMTPYWQRLGFPFAKLVPSYATAIGSSSDRPAALAELVGIIVNDGVAHPSVLIRELTLAKGTPYETSLERSRPISRQLLDPAVAATLRKALQGVVEKGTAQRISGAIKEDGLTATIGGKTGSGDNRKVQVGRSGRTISSRAVNRTATFVFYLGDRYFGVITAYVQGPKADQYNFTSALPVSVLRLLAPEISSRWREEPTVDQSELGDGCVTKITAINN